MAYASQSGRARTSARNPRAFGVCQRCGQWWNRDQLRFQYDWRGATIQNLYILVCEHCYDTPAEQLRAITIPADPVPVFYPSVENFEQDESDYRAVSYPTVTDPVTGIPIPSTVLRTTEDCQNRVVTPYGNPVGHDPNAIMPLVKGITYGTQLQILSVTGNGTATVQVTCSAPHGLQTNAQISAQGLAYTPACGFYSVTVLGATTFTYMTYGNTPAQALLTPTTRIVTANIGLPLGFVQIAKISGPSLFTTTPTVCFFETEDGSGMFLLETGSGYLQLEMCGQTPVGTYLFELETSAGTVLLESGSGSLELENGP
jgi:hypothetical protein